MDAIKFEGVDCMAVAKDCFDLPLMQCVDVCGNCKGDGFTWHGVGEGPHRAKVECPTCKGVGYERVRLVTNWKFTAAEWQHMVDHPEARGIFLSVCAVHTPPVLVTLLNPTEMWPGVVVPVKKLMQEAEEGAPSLNG